MFKTFTILTLFTSSVIAFGETCDHSIKRLKEGPEMYADIIQAGRPYEDTSFTGRDMLYWLGYEDFGRWRDYEWNLWFGTFQFQRITEVYPDATMFGNNNPSWHDIMQGLVGTCYIEASLAAISEFPALVSNVFLTQEKNDVGIYAFRFYIRGKPWIITVDDYFLFYTSQTTGKQALFARIGQNEQFWAMMLEKAWAKMKGTYSMADGGFTQNGLRALVGCPVVSLDAEGQDPDVMFTTLKTANDLNYIMAAGTVGTSDTIQNECGIAMMHAYTLIAAFELKTGGTVDHKMYMLRNPWGVSYFNQSWNYADPAWTTNYKSQVPHNVDPTTSQAQGIFFVNSTDLLRCFTDFQIAHYRDGEGYSDTWYDKENDDGQLSQYEVTVPANDGDLYFTVETYYYGLVPSTCWEGGQAPKVSFKVYKNAVSDSNLVFARESFDAYHWPIQVVQSNYTAGDKFYITVQYDWQFGLGKFPARDYTLKLYSKQNLPILDSQGKTNMWHMDGQFPSGFTKSHYRKDTTSWTPEWKPRSMYDIWLVSNNVQQFANLVFNNIWTLFVWYSN